MFAVTPRLYLRPKWPEDAVPVFLGIADWEIVKNLGRAPWPYTLEDAEDFIARESDAGGADFLAFERGSGALVGSIGFGRWLGPDKEIEIGYWLARDFWGLGLAAEAGRAVLEIAFEVYGLERIAAGHFVDNPKSGAVLRKLGFEPTDEVVPCPCEARGREVDSVEYLLPRERWKAARSAREAERVAEQIA